MIVAQARSVPGALLERCRLLWARDKGHRAMLELQLALQQQLEGGGGYPRLCMLRIVCSLYVACLFLRSVIAPRHSSRLCICILQLQQETGGGLNLPLSTERANCGA